MYGLLIESIIEIIKAKYGENIWVSEQFKKE